MKNLIPKISILKFNQIIILDSLPESNPIPVVQNPKPEMMSDEKPDPTPNPIIPTRYSPNCDWRKSFLDFQIQIPIPSFSYPCISIPCLFDRDLHVTKMLRLHFWKVGVALMTSCSALNDFAFNYILAARKSRPQKWPHISEFSILWGRSWNFAYSVPTL